MKTTKYKTLRRWRLKEFHTPLRNKYRNLRFQQRSDGGHVVAYACKEESFVSPKCHERNLSTERCTRNTQAIHKFALMILTRFKMLTSVYLGHTTQRRCEYDGCTRNLNATQTCISQARNKHRSCNSHLIHNYCHAPTIQQHMQCSYVDTAIIHSSVLLHMQ